MSATLVIAAHGTRSEAGSATTHALMAALRDARPGLDVTLAFLDVAAPSLTEVLDHHEGDVTVVPLLLSAGYHVESDIPSIVAGRSRVRVTPHLGPDPLVLRAVAERLAEAGGSPGAATTLLATVPSSRPAAAAEVARAADLLAELLGCPVSVLTLGAEVRGSLDAAAGPVRIATYLLAEGTFLTELRSLVADDGVVAAPIGVHPALVELVLARYDQLRS